MEEGTEEVKDFLEEFVAKKCTTDKDREYWEKIILCLFHSKKKIHQTDLVNLFDISKSKVSIVLTAMQSADLIQKVLDGKENLIRPSESLRDFFFLNKNLFINKLIQIGGRICLAKNDNISSLSLSMEDRLEDDNKQKTELETSISRIIENIIDVIEGGYEMPGDERSDNKTDSEQDDLRKGAIKLSEDTDMMKELMPEGETYAAKDNSKALPLLLETLARLYHLEGTWKESNAINARLIKENHNVKSEVAKQKLLLETIKKELFEISEVVANQNVEKTVLQRKFDALDQEYEILQNSIEDIKRENSDAKKIINEKEKALASLGEKITTFTAENQELNTMNVRSGNRLLELEKEIKSLKMLEEENIGLKNQIEASTQRYQDFESLLKEKKALDAKVIDLQKSLGEKDMIILDLNKMASEVNSLKEQIGIFKEKLSGVQSEKKGLEDQIALMQEEINRLSDMAEETSSGIKRPLNDPPQKPLDDKEFDRKKAVLALLENGKMTQSKIWEKTGITRSYLSEILKKLVSEGAIISSQDPEDKRGHLIELSEEYKSRIKDASQNKPKNDSPDIKEIQEVEFEPDEVQKKFLLFFVKNPKGISVNKVIKSTGYSIEIVNSILSLFGEMALVRIKKQNSKDFVVVDTEKIREDFPDLIQEESSKELEKKLDDAMLKARQLLRKDSSILLANLHGRSGIGKEYSEKLIEKIKLEFAQEYSISLSDPEDFTKCRIDFVAIKGLERPEPKKTETNEKDKEAKPINKNLLKIARDAENNMQSAILRHLRTKPMNDNEIIYHLSKEGITANPADINVAINRINGNGGPRINKETIGEKTNFSIE